MTAIILPFRPRPRNRMTQRDRHEAVDWVERARSIGYTRIAFDTSGVDGDPELGDYILVYGRDDMWASWGVGRSNGRFILWRAADGQTLAIYDTIRDALAAIPPPAARKLSA